MSAVIREGRSKGAPHDSTESGALSFLQYGSLSGYNLSLLVSHFRLRLQPIVQSMPLFSSALLVHFVGTTTDLLLKLGCWVRHFCPYLI